MTARPEPPPEIVNVTQKRPLTPFALWLRAARGSIGITQKELAAAAGVQATYLSEMEVGKRVPLPRMIRRLAGALLPTGDDRQRAALRDEGLRAAGYVPERHQASQTADTADGAAEYMRVGRDEAELLRFLRSQSPCMVPRTLAALKALFAEEALFAEADGGSDENGGSDESCPPSPRQVSHV